MDFNILKDIVIIFALSTFVNFIFTKVKIPTIIGYLITGIIAGPHLLGLIHSPNEIELMAEIGVIILMFTIGLEFSLNHLMKIRNIVFLGGLIQLTATAGVTMLVAKLYQMSWSSALFIGFLIALSSTAVVLKILQDRSELTSNYGRTVLGILIFQDIIVIPLLLFTPLLGGEVVDFSHTILILLLKTVGIMVFVWVGNKWIMPKLLHIIAMTKNQELFLMSILLFGLSVALLTSELGMTLAFGAFLAGLMISESEYSHNAFGNLIPFKDTFTSFFFVSIGMLLDLHFVVINFQLVILTVVLVIVIKTIIGGGTAFLLGHTFKGTVLVGLALSQVGEFSFIVAKTGMDYTIISDYYYQLFLAVAIISMSVSPLIIKIATPIAKLLLKLPVPKILVNGLFPLKEIDVPELQNHLVFIGKDSRSFRLSTMAKFMNLPYVSIIFDPAIVRKRQIAGDIVIYGDANNEPVLNKARVDTAAVVVVSIGDLITSMAVVEKIRNLNKHAFIIARTRHVYDIEDLYTCGANQVIPEEFETAIEIFERVLKKLLIPRGEIESAIARIRDYNYGIFREKDDRESLSLSGEIPNIEIIALIINNYPFFIDKSLKEINLRKLYGLTLVAVKRDNDIIGNPDSNLVLKKDDIAYILGKPDQIAVAMEGFTRIHV
jgi:monovalent cation:H+ antiporter-2, CPA2 family